MSANDIGSSSLLRTAAEARADLADLARICARLGVLRRRLPDEASDMAVPAAVALWLDHYYTAVEATIGRLVTALDGALPGGEDWHLRLLRVAALEVPALRPAIISAGTRTTLDELRGFRHKLRHTYLLEIAPERVATLADAALACHELLAEDLDAFVTWLGELAHHATPSASD